MAHVAAAVSATTSAAAEALLIKAAQFLSHKVLQAVTRFHYKAEELAMISGEQLIVGMDLLHSLHLNLKLRKEKALGFTQWPCSVS